MNAERSEEANIMGIPARLQAALDRLEARRTQLEAHIVAELETRFFATPSAVIDTIVSSHDGPDVTGANIDTTGVTTGNSSHITITWFEND